MRLPLCVALVAGVCLAPSAALAAAVQDEALEAQIRILQDLTRPDEQRAAARTHLINFVARGEQAAVERVLRLGQETTQDNVRLHVAFILAQARMGKSIVPAARAPAVIKLLSEWLAADKGDAGVRLWAAVGIANTQAEDALPLLTDKALKSDGDPVLRAAAARALATWRGENLVKLVVPLLVELLKDKDVDVRIAGCDALRLTDLDDQATVGPLLEVARGDPEERVWRAAVACLRRLGGGALSIPQGAEDGDRKQKLQTWENVWRKKKKVAAKEKEEGT